MRSKKKSRPSEVAEMVRPAGQYLSEEGRSRSLKAEEGWRRPEKVDEGGREDQKIGEGGRWVFTSKGQKAGERVA